MADIKLQFATIQVLFFMLRQQSAAPLPKHTHQPASS